MNKFDTKRLALILAVQAELDGMRFENERNKECGQYYTYTAADFFEKAEMLREIANE